MGPRRLRNLLVASLVMAAAATYARAVPPTAADMINYKPRMKDVAYSTPSPDELAQCKVEPVKNAKGQSIGWQVVDGRKLVLRRFLATGGTRIDVYSYFKDGVEVYRELCPPKGDAPDQYRWFNEGGMRWGRDFNGDGKIDFWHMISAEEAGHEAFDAVAQRDFARLQALFITDAEMRSLKLPTSQIDRIKGQIARASKKFQETCAKLPAGAKFIRVEGAPPNCIPGDAMGPDAVDLVHFPSRTVLYEFGAAEKKHDWLQTGEMIQVGLTWRLVDAPGEVETTTPPEHPLLAKLYKDLETIDKRGLKPFAKDPSDVALLMQRVAIIEQLLPLLAATERENWIKQMLDNLGTAAAYLPPGKDNAAMLRLGQVKDQLVKGLPGSNLAGTAVFREMCAIYLPILSGGRRPDPGKDLAKTQEEWHDQLTKFVQAYPNVEETPTALDYLGTGAEFAGKEGEAKRWYTQIFENFKGNHLAPKALGCVRRLDSVGQPMELTSPTLDRSAVFNITQLKGKMVAVYYWASYCTSCPADFQKLKSVQQSLALKGLEMVFVNLDDEPAEAAAFLRANPVPGIHLYQPAKTGGGLNSPLAIHYGINGLPTMFLVGRDGKVVNRTLQAGDLQDAFNKAQ